MLKEMDTLRVRRIMASSCTPRRAGSPGNSARSVAVWTTSNTGSLVGGPRLVVRICLCRGGAIPEGQDSRNWLFGICQPAQALLEEHLWAGDYWVWSSAMSPMRPGVGPKRFSEPAYMGQSEQH